VENTVHWVRDVVFDEDKSQVRARNTSAVLAAVRDLIHSALKLAGYANTAAGRRAHTERHRVLTLYDIT
jgi:predicted transposase YbfD/YdcC